jgi:hypothetical protein
VQQQKQERRTRSVSLRAEFEEEFSTKIWKNPEDDISKMLSSDAKQFAKLLGGKQ